MMENLNINIQHLSQIPKYVFIVPYRDRIQHKTFFSTYIEKVMEDIPKQDWIYYFIHQNDNRPFNRGAMKNIGFLAIKYKYPVDYKNIILIFNDIDTLPYDKNVIDFNTSHGNVKHFYGFNFALGGIFSITAGDFEKTNGFPNFWAWGGEDNLIHDRAKRVGLTIDRSTFFVIGDMNILQFADGFKRLICRNEIATTLDSDNHDGITTIKNLNYAFNDDNHRMIDVSSFDTLISPKSMIFEEQTLDQIGKIRVSTKNMCLNDNIVKIKNNLFKDVGKPANINIMLNNAKNPNPNVSTHMRGKQPDANINLNIRPPSPVIQNNRRFGMRSLFM